MPNKTSAQTSQSLQTSKYTSELLSRLNARNPISDLQNHPPPTGRVRTYASVTRPTSQSTSTQISTNSTHTELREIKAAITTLQTHEKATDAHQLKDINLAISELATAATLTNTTLTNTAGEKENIIRELTAQQDQQFRQITQHQDQQMDKMLESFQKFIQEMMRDMFTQVSTQMTSLLTSLLPMITNSQPTRTPAVPQYAPQQFTHPMQHVSPQLVPYPPPPMLPGGHLSTVVSTPS